jgi:hypothetical protein
MSCFHGNSGRANFLIFGSPFVANWDEASGFHYEQLPGYRWLGFYTNFYSTFFVYPTHSRWISFWDGMYATFWGDGHGRFATERLQIGLMRPILWFAAVPTAAILLGFAHSLKTSLKKPLHNRDSALVLYTFLSLTATLYFTMKVPFYSTINARFLLPLIIPISVFSGKGLQAMCVNLGRLKWWLYGHVATFYALIIFVFWYRP